MLVLVLPEDVPDDEPPLLLLLLFVLLFELDELVPAAGAVNVTLALIVPQAEAHVTKVMKTRRKLRVVRRIFKALKLTLEFKFEIEN